VKDKTVCGSFGLLFVKRIRDYFGFRMISFARVVTGFVEFLVRIVLRIFVGPPEPFGITKRIGGSEPPCGICCLLVKEYCYPSNCLALRAVYFSDTNEAS
jgi:hypothetical protein